MPVSAWGLEHTKIDDALPFTELIQRANGDGRVVMEAAKMKDQWRRRVSFLLLQQNANALLNYQNSGPSRPRRSGLAAGWHDRED